MRAAWVNPGRRPPPEAARSVLDGCEHDGTINAETDNDIANAATPGSTMAQAQRVNMLTSSVGVNIHLPGGQGNAYGELNIATIASDLSYLGASLIRDDVLNTASVSSGVKARYAALTQAGLKFDLCVGSSNSGLDAIMAALNAFAAANPDAIRYVEGANEINYNSFSYKGMTGQSAAILFQKDLRDAVHASPLLAGVQVLDFTGGGALIGPNQAPEPIADIADLAATHVYPALGDPPAWYVSTTYQAQYGTAITAPYLVTEAGYNSDPTIGNGVSRDVQAKQTLMLLLDTTRSGATATILYELLDMYADPGNQIYDDHWGLFDATGTPKEAAVGIHNLLATLSDSSATAANFTPDRLNYMLSNMPPAGRDWLLQKSSGVFDLVLWSEVPIWDSATRSPLINPGSSVTIDLGRNFDYVDVYDPLAGSAAIAHITAARQITVNLADHPLVLQFGLNLPAPSTVTLYPSIKIITGERDGGVTLVGNSPANSRVTVSDTVNGITTTMATVTTSSTGMWSLTSHTMIKLTAINSFTVSAQDTMGNSGSMTGQFLLASTGADTLKGRTGASDVFAIMSFKGSDVIKGFETSAAVGSMHDYIDFSGRGITSFNQLKPMISGEASAVISIGNGKLITVSDVAASTLTAADFRFS